MRYVPKADFDHLVAEILAGRCVAFVGAGFSAAAGLPSWPVLLTDIARGAGLDGGHEGLHLSALLERKDAHAYDQAAQFIEDRITRPRLVAALSERLGKVAPNASLATRLDLLAGIPFRAILTTNFDGLLRGAVPGPQAYIRVLRGTPEGPWSDLFRQVTGGELRRPDQSLVVKLHGDLADEGSVVFTRRDYRRRLYEQPGYVEFLRAVMASYTVLFMGFSFTDAYLNELRSETLALVNYGVDHAPFAYAIRDGLDELSCDYFREHEGIRLLPYAVKKGSHQGFEQILRAIYERTNPLPRLARLLAGKRILWVDAHPQNNEAGIRFFEAAAALERRSQAHLEFVSDAASALAALDAPGTRRFDLVITHWGRDVKPPTAVRLLQGLATRPSRAPTLVFSSAENADPRKRRALKLGARAYCFEWTDLLREVERLFAKASESP